MAYTGGGKWGNALLLRVSVPFEVDPKEPSNVTRQISQRTFHAGVTLYLTLKCLTFIEIEIYKFDIAVKPLACIIM